MKKNVLVFPCGSELGLELSRSLKNDKHFRLIGCSSVDDSGKYFYDKYINDLPFINHKNFIERINEIIESYEIDLFYPLIDSVIHFCITHRNEFKCQVIGPSFETSLICLSKKKTYEKFENILPIPQIYNLISSDLKFPLFLKPEIGHSGKGTVKVENLEELNFYSKKRSDLLILEYLPGDEFTVDCFTSFNRELKFVGVRIRKKMLNGISVNTEEIEGEINDKLNEYAQIINKNLILQGSWFFQVKYSDCHKLTLMEVACRYAGSSALFRAKGINLALLTLWDTLHIKVSFIKNNYNIEINRPLDIKYFSQINYKNLYIDLDDTILIDNKLNTDAISLIIKSINNEKKIICITKHKKNPSITLKTFKIFDLFDEIIHLNESEKKSDFILNDSIFVDDSFLERKQVHDQLGINVFSVEMIKILL
jgi:hypothetical protein